MYEATIEDPKVFTRPWKIRFPLYRHMEQDFQLLEFKCEPFTEEMLYGRFVKRPLREPLQGGAHDSSVRRDLGIRRW